ncbi:MAG: hypothetical protein LBS56_10765 [Propionibacteriaceae bacterium]|jgi:hypothetical protein|nr:hypothetical protein [Propionibacteriaceae bacterium]
MMASKAVRRVARAGSGVALTLLLWAASAGVASADPSASAIPDPPAIAPPGSERLTELLGMLKWGALALCLAALIGGGAMIAFASRRGEGQEAAKKVAFPLLGVVVIAGAAALIGFVAGT